MWDFGSCLLYQRATETQNYRLSTSDVTTDLNSRRILFRLTDTLERTNTLNSRSSASASALTNNRDARRPNTHLSVVSERGPELPMTSFLNFGGRGLRSRERRRNDSSGGIFAFQRRRGKSEKVSLFGRPSFGRLRGLVVSVRRVRGDFQPGSEDRSENTAFYTELVRYA